MKQSAMKEEWDLDFWEKYINDCDDILESITKGIKIENNIENVIIKNCARSIVSLREMIILLSNGYPDGALAIARNIYETVIITGFIYNNYLTVDNLIERYFTDQDVIACKNKKPLYQAIKEVWPSLEWPDVEIKKKQCSNERAGKKYNRFQFHNYWWAEVVKKPRGHKNFSKIDEVTNHDKFSRVLYKRACQATHINAMSSFLLGRKNSEGNIIYTSNTYEGFEAPLLLGIYSFDKMISIVCSHWKIEKSTLLPDLRAYYEKYVQNVFK